MLPPFMSQALIRAFNTLLDREPWAQDRLRAHAGKSMRLLAGALDLSLRIDTNGKISETSTGSPNVTVTVHAADLPRLVRATESERLEYIRIDGEAALAHVVADLARHLRWDIEDELAALIGDIPARRVVGALKSLVAGARTGAARMAENVAEYIAHEARMVVDRPSFEAFARHLQQLEHRLDQLEVRARATLRSKGPA